MAGLVLPEKIGLPAARRTKWEDRLLNHGHDNPQICGRVVFTGWATRRMDGRGERVPSAMNLTETGAINQGGRRIFAGDDGIGHFRLLLAFLYALILPNCLCRKCPTAEGSYPSRR